MYKAEPEKFGGSVSDIAEILRIAVTGKPNSPDLCSIMKILGGARSVGRMKNSVFEMFPVAVCAELGNPAV